ncbi:MAG: hypothetical protein ACTSWN_15735 [Promethearchaeota archaeon]
MIKTLTINPMIGIFIAAITQTVFLTVTLISSLQKEKIKRFKPHQKKVFDFFQFFGIGTMYNFGFLFVDIGGSWLLGNWSMSDWQFQFPSVILLILIGLEYVLILFMHKSSILDVIFGAISAITTIIFIHWWVPSHGAVMGEPLKKYFPLIIGVLIGIYVFIGLFKALILEKKDQNRKEKHKKLPITWNNTEKLKKIFNIKVNLILWALVVIQNMLILHGLSILTIYTIF